MNFLGTIKLVFRTLLARKGRSFLTILGIVIGVAGVITIIALGAGAQALILGQVNKFGTNLVSISPGKTNEKGPPAAVFGIIITSLLNADADALRDSVAVPHAKAVNAMVRGSEQATWQNRQSDINYVGTDANYPNVVSITMQKGRFFSAEEQQGNANVAVIGSGVYEDLFKENNIEPLGQIIKIKSIPLRVIGVISPRGSVFGQNQDQIIYLPLGIGQTQLLGIHYLQAINIKVDAAENVKQTIEDAKRILKQRHKILRDVDADYTIQSIADAISILSIITNALRLFLTAMAAIALVVGGIGILNIMLVTVAERTREIGLRKAVGASNAAVRNQFLLEASLLTLLGGVIGIIVGVIVSYLIALLMQALKYDWAFIISPLSVILSIGVSVLTGIIFGLYPAFKASKLDPIEALRYE